MKKFFIIAVLLCVTLLARHAAAISQSSVYFQLGLDDLTNQDLVDANSNFVLAVSSDPTDEDANLLLAATRLLVVPQTPAGSTFLNQLGFPAAGRNIYDWTSFPPTNSAGKPQFPSGYNSSTVITLYTTTLLPLVQASLTNLANITDPNFQYFLPNNVATGNEVEGNGGVTLDYGDVEMLRALLAASEFAGFTLSANNADVNLSQVETAIFGNTLTIRSLLSTYPSLGVLQNTSALADSKSAGTNAIQFYFVASDFIRNARIDTNALFNLDPNDAGQEAKFRTELTNILESLAEPTEFASSARSTVNLAAYFSGTNSLRKLAPQFNGDTYVPDSVPDYTFGGVLPDLPSFQTETFLTEKFPNYAGIYIGESQDNPNAIYDSYGYSDGGFAVYVSTNGQLTLVGHDDENGLGNGFGIFIQTTLEAGGNWSYNDSFVNASGNIDKQGNFFAQLYYPDANGVSVSLQGALQSPQGAFQNTDGFYTGSFSGSGSGTLDVIFDANGDIFYVPIAPGGASEYGNQQQGGSGQFSSSTQFSIFPVTGTIVAGTLNPNAFVITGIYTNFDGSHGNFTVSRSSRVLFDLPPTITTDLPPSLVLPIGNVATFHLGASGGAPLSYQWFFDGSAVPGATTSTLIVSNLWTVPGIYDIWATVTNIVGGTNSQVCAVSIVTETNIPTVAITAPVSGQVWSNSLFEITGTASDKVGVTGVVCSVNGTLTAVNPNPTYNNWYSLVELAPGSNSISAYSINNGFIQSKTATVLMDYVPTAPLTVVTNGKGIILPNDNGQLLRIGTNYTLTATAASGFVFSSWSSGLVGGPLTVYTNKATVMFTMASNLELQANFQDTLAPYLKITNATSGMIWSNSTFTVMGVATDDEALATVQFSLNGSSYADVGTSNGWTNWNQQLTLMAGTNLFTIYAQATNNNTITNSINIVYDATNQLTVAISGRGTISPNYSNAWLYVGQNYSMTASPAPGMIFTNWTATTNNGTFVLYGSKPTVQFMMASNLDLQANFLDTLKPYLKITNATSGMIWSNSSFTVMGVATDDEALASVQYSLNGSPFTNVVTGNGWTNWSQQLTLTAGTNLFTVYAQATNNNAITNSVDIVYEATNQLQVTISGRGTISPNYSNAWLFVGQNYSMTASPTPGMVFTNWTAATNNGPFVLYSSKPTVQFMMASNLDLQANFLDTLKPYLKITNATSGMLWSNSSFTVTGVATDDEALASVQFSLNGSSYQTVGTSNGWTNWNQQLTLAAGTNLFTVYAQATNNNTTTNSIDIVFVSPNQLNVAISGRGTISPNYSNALLNVGVNYSMTASPAPGMIFTNWTASTNNGTFVLYGSKPAVQFMMASNLDLQANFLDTIKPYLKITNAVSGMLWTNPTFTVMGVATDDEAMAIVQYSLNGSLYSEAGTGNGWTNWSEQLPLQAGTNLFTIYAQATNNNSITNSIDIVCVSTNQLHLTVSGRGTISPNYSNAWLNVGVNYSMTASPAPGMIFTNWTATTNNGTFVLYGSKPTVQFMMASNLDLQANFLDTLKPYIKITNATSAMLWTNPSFTVMGVATDDEAMALVNYSFNGSDFTESTSDNGWTNWSEKLSLNEGTNTFAVYALATNGNVSATNLLTIIRYPTIATFLIASNSDITEPQAQIAFDGTNYLVVYQKQLTNGSPAFGQFVSQAGSLLGAPLDLNTNGSGDPACLDFDGSNYLVAWADYSDQAGGVPIRGVFVSPDTNKPPGSILTLSQSGTVKDFNTIVYGNGVYFLMWNDDRTTPPSIYGAIVNSLGTNISGDFEIGTNGQTSEVGEPAAAFDGTDFLTVWASATGAMNIKGQLIDTSGNLVGAPIVIYTNSAPAGYSLPCVVFDGTKFLVLFNTSVNSTLSASSYHILGRFVTPVGGVLTNQITLTTDGGPQVIAGADFDGVNYLVSWNQGFNPFVMDTSATIYGRFLDMQGNPSTSEFPIFTTQPGAEIPLWAPVYWDGSQFVLVGGFGHMLHPAPDLEFTNGVIDGSFISP